MESFITEHLFNMNWHTSVWMSSRFETGMPCSISSRCTQRSLLDKEPLKIRNSPILPNLNVKVEIQTRFFRLTQQPVQNTCNSKVVRGASKWDPVKAKFLSFCLFFLSIYDEARLKMKRIRLINVFYLIFILSSCRITIHV